MRLASEPRSLNSWIDEVNKMSGQFMKVSCKDCGNESVIFSRATTIISCGVCGATLTNPSGGKAELVGCTVLETLE